jgi:hypothetical protein
MPPVDFPQFDRFVRAVHRRLKLLRLIECVGLGVTAACGLGLPLIFLLAWRGVGGLGSTAIILMLGALAGIGWALTHAPTPLQAAMEADRQLGLADLLGSAMLLRGGAADPWKAAVLAEAEARCRGLIPSAILVRRLGPRAWSGIALTIGIALTLSAWIGAPAQTLAEGANPVATPAATARNDSRPLLEPINPSSRISSAPRDGEDAANSSTLPEQTATDPQSFASPGSSTTPPGAATDGQGGSLSRTNAPQPEVGPQRQGFAPGRESAARGHSAGGNAGAADATVGDTNAAGLVGQTSVLSSPPTPWSSGRWPDAVESAQHQIDNGQVPPAYRDLVREYFQRP